MFAISTRTLNKPTATFVRLGMLLDPSSASASTLMLLYSMVTSGRLTPAAQLNLTGEDTELLDAVIAHHDLLMAHVPEVKPQLVVLRGPSSPLGRQLSTFMAAGAAPYMPGPTSCLAPAGTLS